MNRSQLEKLLAINSENEIIEFKEAKEDFSLDRLGKYFSALSNEAAIGNYEAAYLVFGVEDKINEDSGKRNIVGSNYRDKGGLQKLKQEIFADAEGKTFKNIYEETIEEKRVIVFEIAPAKNNPVSWRNSWYQRNGESLVAMTLDKINLISSHDWSSLICDQATINDLDVNAIRKAKELYASKQRKEVKEEILKLDDLSFLKRANIIAPNGKITNTSIILLGKEESPWFISPHVAKISWRLNDVNGKMESNDHFGPPFVLNIDKVLSVIRNIKFRYIPGNTLFSSEIDKYDTEVIREALTNCIAHQDYNLKGIINVIETPDCLIFENVGSFIPETIERVLKRKAPQSFYRNRHLVNAMINLQMIEQGGSGIGKMFDLQRHRLFPLPDYDLSDNRVKVTIYGKIIDENYVKVLSKKNEELDLFEVISLDKIQKKQKIDKNIADELKKKKLVEGRYPNIFVAGHLAISDEDRVNYIKNKGFKDSDNKRRIIDFLGLKPSSRRSINDLLMDRLPNVLNQKQKQNKIRNLLYSMQKQGLIECSQKGTNPIWRLRKAADSLDTN